MRSVCLRLVRSNLKRRSSLRASYGAANSKKICGRVDVEQNLCAIFVSQPRHTASMRADFKICARRTNRYLLASGSLPFCAAPAVWMSSFGLRAARLNFKTALATRDRRRAELTRHVEFKECFGRREILKSPCAARQNFSAQNQNPISHVVCVPRCEI